MQVPGCLGRSSVLWYDLPIDPKLLTTFMIILECHLSPMECLNSGNVSSGEFCECSCHYPWSGVHCDLCGRQCRNGGSANPNDHKASCICVIVRCFLTFNRVQCQCSCQWPFKGDECETCAPNCVRGRNITLPDREFPLRSSFPPAPLDVVSCVVRCVFMMHHTRVGCGCECPPLAKGERCEECPARCLNGGVLDRDTCTCKCLGYPPPPFIIVW